MAPSAIASSSTRPRWRRSPSTIGRSGGVTPRRLGSAAARWSHPVSHGPTPANCPTSPPSAGGTWTRSRPVAPSGRISSTRQRQTSSSAASRGSRCPHHGSCCCASSRSTVAWPCTARTSRKPAVRARPARTRPLLGRLASTGGASATVYSAVTAGRPLRVAGDQPGERDPATARALRARLGPALPGLPPEPCGNHDAERNAGTPADVHLVHRPLEKARARTAATDLCPAGCRHPDRLNCSGAAGLGRRRPQRGRAQRRSGSRT